MLKYLILFSIAAFSTLLLTPAVRFVAIRLGAVDLPERRKIHTRPMPRLGGVSVFVIFHCVLLFTLPFDFFFFPPDFLKDTHFGWLFVASVTMVAIGAVDDFRRVPAGVKLFFQILAAFLVATKCCRIDFISLPFGTIHLGIWSLPVTILWIAGITNAINLLDGLDGLAAGTSLIVCMVMFGLSILQQNIGMSLVYAILGGSILGFLRYNFNPASIFLGDSGAYFLGFILSVLSLMSHLKGSATIAIIIPILALGLPIIDTSLSMFRRLLSSLHIMEVDREKNIVKFLYFDGWTIFKADRDHIHHRLLQIGFTQRKAVILLYGVSLFFGAAALSTTYFINMNYALLISSLVVAAYTGLKRLGYTEIRLLSNGSLLPLFDIPAAHRRLFQVLIDMALISLSFYLSFLLRFEGDFLPWKNVYLTTLPLILLAKIVVFSLAGLYSGVWQYTSIGELLRMVKAVFLGSLLSLVLLGVVPGYSIHSRALLIIDFNLLLLLMVGIRAAFRILEHLQISRNQNGKKILIYGAGRTGVSTLKEVLHNPTLGLRPVGFIDDNPHIQKKTVNGYPVLGTLDSLEGILKDNSIYEVILGTNQLPKETLDRLTNVCSSLKIPLCHFQTQLIKL